MPLPSGIKLISLQTPVPLDLCIRDGDRGWERAQAQAAEALAYQIFSMPFLLVQKETSSSLLERMFEFHTVVMHPRTLRQMMETKDDQSSGSQILDDHEAPSDRGLGQRQDGEPDQSD